MVVRLEGPVAPFAAAVRRLAAQMAPDIPAPILTTMSSELDSSISSERMMAMLSAFFAGCALLVTAIGLYGTLSYATARRTSEIGIRIALGAQRGQVVALIFRENAWIAAGGALAGLIAALLALRALASFLLWHLRPRSLGDDGINSHSGNRCQRRFADSGHPSLPHRAHHRHPLRVAIRPVQESPINHG